MALSTLKRGKQTTIHVSIILKLKKKKQHRVDTTVSFDVPQYPNQTLINSERVLFNFVCQTKTASKCVLCNAVNRLQQGVLYFQNVWFHGKCQFICPAVTPMFIILLNAQQHYVYSSLLKGISLTSHNKCVIYLRPLGEVWLSVRWFSRKS